jgi:hypothetical protein
MNTATLVSLRAGITAAREDFHTLYSFYTGTTPIDMLDDFLTLGDLFEDPIKGRAWSRTMCREVYRLESLFV